VDNELNKSYNLRNLLDLKIPDKGKYNDFGEETSSNISLVNLLTQ
jgi:hypothetical protein